MDIPDDSYIYADKAYNDYVFEDQLKEFGIRLITKRKVNSKREHSGPMSSLQKIYRKRISQIVSFMPRSIHAVGQKDF